MGGAMQAPEVSDQGCDRMGIRHVLQKKTMTGWRNVWSIKWRVPDQEVDQKEPAEVVQMEQWGCYGL